MHKVLICKKDSRSIPMFQLNLSVIQVKELEWLQGTQHAELVENQCFQSLFGDVTLAEVRKVALREWALQGHVGSI
jgi:hypothetical protein